eukprot:CAMPEP_0115118370 /NCGR_PEP_ID=MMETSP0227-20121206/44451_1 /TAXON_ID=89957 /ORGANISM="Polarella glacialis, Strain CCMP 1383" /LENGTH=388 /DNA_ID=CAMNT_0002519627 /DNA_START=65 /DNA_END=1231 /DNA_ORIENTATION=+
MAPASTQVAFSRGRPEVRQLKEKPPSVASSRTPSRTPSPVNVMDSIPHKEVLKFHKESALTCGSSREKESDDTDPSTPRQRPRVDSKLKLVFRSEERGLPPLNRGWRTPDPSPTRSGRGLPKCASRSFIVDCSDNEEDDSLNVECGQADETEPAWARIRTPSPGEDRNSSHRLMLPATQSAPEMCMPYFELSCLPCASPAWADLEDEHDGNDFNDDDKTPTYNGSGSGCCSGSDKAEGETCLVSMGSLGHPYTCAEACKYSKKARGCKDGPACDRCHLCEWKRYDRKLGDEPIPSKWTGGSGGQGGTTPARPQQQGAKNFPVRRVFRTAGPTTVNNGGARGVASLEVSVPAAANSEYPAYARGGRTSRRAGAKCRASGASGGAWNAAA